MTTGEDHINLALGAVLEEDFSRAQAQALIAIARELQRMNNERAARR